MNFLAHIYLSGDDDLIKIGNFMADGIRGKGYQLMPERIRKGVLLHREIDTFTDAHPTFRQSTKRLHENYHHYAGVIVDVFYDHFLARNWTQYSNERLEAYVENFYRSLHENHELLTPKTKQILPVMQQYNWLLSYRETQGLARILSQMDYRTNHISRMTHSINDLVEHYGEFEQEFTTFFAELRSFAEEKRAAL
ncbi:MAG TPA: acyl carrier protein phosphodiesterase [Flavobacterium sp.]|jgi:acyl carrier protein phosphodiesterase